MPRYKFGPENPDITYIPHKYKEQLVDLGDAAINYATIGSPDKPALLLIPGQTESWWGYEKAMGLLEDKFQVFAVDLRGQGRSSRTPGRYTWDNFGNDMVKFITFVISRPVVVSGLSSGGVIAAWLSAYAPPGMIIGAHYEDPPLFSSEVQPAYGTGIRRGAGGRFEILSTYLGNQWCVGDWEGARQATHDMLAAEPPQNMKEYDPEWAKACITGSIGTSCDHAQMLTHVKCPVLFTHHLSRMDEETGKMGGAASIYQVDQVERIIKSTGQPFTRIAIPNMGHQMHGIDPDLFVRTLVDWVKTLPSEEETRKKGVFSSLRR